MPISPKKKAAFYSIASGMTLITFWALLYQTKNESDLHNYGTIDTVLKRKKFHKII